MLKSQPISVGIQSLEGSGSGQRHSRALAGKRHNIVGWQRLRMRLPLQLKEGANAFRLGLTIDSGTGDFLQLSGEKGVVVEAHCFFSFFLPPLPAFFTPFLAPVSFLLTLTFAVLF